MNILALDVVFYIKEHRIYREFHLSLLFASDTIIARHELREFAEDFDECKLHFKYRIVLFFQATLTDFSLELGYESLFTF